MKVKRAWDESKHNRGTKQEMSKKRGTDASVFLSSPSVDDGRTLECVVHRDTAERIYIDAQTFLCANINGEFFLSLFHSSGGCHTAQCRNRSLNWSIVFVIQIIPLLLLLLLEMKKHTQTLEELKIWHKKERGWKMLLLLYCVRLAEWWNLSIP